MPEYNAQSTSGEKGWNRKGKKRSIWRGIGTKEDAGKKGEGKGPERDDADKKETIICWG